jgi:hypothetical protein
MKTRKYEGKWLYVNNKCIEDEVCIKIQHMIQDELILMHSHDIWEKLYYDPEQCEYWELTYPFGEMQGGGPPELTQVSFQYAQEKYGITLEQQEELKNKHQSKRKM